MFGIFENIDLNRFLASFEYMWKGMLGIFVVMGIIIISVYIMGFFSKKAAQRKEAEQEDKE